MHNLDDLHSFIELIPDLVFFKDIQGRYTHFNNTFLDFYNASREDIIMKTDYELFSKENADNFCAVDEEILFKNKDRNYEESFIHKNSSKIHFDTSKQIIYDKNNQQLGLFCIAKDITSKKQYQNIYEDNKSLLEYIAIEHNLDNILNKIIQTAEESNENSKCTITLADQNGCKLINKPKYDYFFTKEIFSSSGKLLGIFSLFNKTEKKFDTFTNKLIETYIHLSSIAIEKYYNYNLIRESEYQRSQLFDNAQSPLMYITKDRKLKKANQRLADTFGYENPSELIGMSMRDLHLSEENFIDFGKNHYDPIKEHDLLNIEYKLCKKDGSHIWCELSGKALDKSKPTDLNNGVLWTVNDISLRKLYQEELKNSELLNKNILRTLPNMVWLKDIDGIYLACNSEFEKFVGAKEKYIVGKTDYDFIDKKTADFFRKNDEKAMKSNKPILNEEWLTYATCNKKILLDTTKKAMRDENGKILGVLGVGHDVTLRKQKEEKLKELNILADSLTKSQASLLSLFDKGDAVLFKWENNDNWSVEYVSSSVSKLLEYEKDEFISGKISYDSCIHNKDLKTVFSEVSNAISNSSDYFKHEPYRIVTKSGEEKWVLDYTVTQKNEKGEITHFIGYITDITEQEQQQKIILQQSKMASLGEMIGNIAHQWRQPLSIISSVATISKVHNDLELLSNNDFDKNMGLINSNAQYLSQTIDDFKNYIRGDKESSKFNLSENIKSFLNVVQTSISNNNIQVIQDLDDDIFMLNYPNDMIQAFLNIINNSIDVLVNLEKDERYFFISTKKVNDIIYISLKDNAKGVDKSFLKKIFEPYTTTKHKSLGTGLGLNITYNFIVNSMNGNILVQNVEYIFEESTYTGLEFIISFEA